MSLPGTSALRRDLVASASLATWAVAFDGGRGSLLLVLPVALRLCALAPGWRVAAPASELALSLLLPASAAPWALVFGWMNRLDRGWWPLAAVVTGWAVARCVGEAVGPEALLVWLYAVSALGDTEAVVAGPALSPPRPEDAVPVPMAWRLAGGSWAMNGAAQASGLSPEPSRDLIEVGGRFWRQTFHGDAAWFCDVTDEVGRAQVATRRAAELKVILEDLPFAVLWEDLEERTSINTAWCGVFAVSPESSGFNTAFAGPLVSQVGGVDGDAIGMRLAAIRRDPSASGRGEVTLADDRQLEFETVPTLAGRVWVVRDVTSTRRDQEGQSQFLLMVLEAIGHPVWVKNSDMEFMGCNSAYLEMRGLPRSVLLGRRESEVCGDTYAEVEEERDLLVLDTGASQEWAEDRVIGGTVRHVVTRRFPTVGPTGGGVIVAVAVDLTAQKLLETELRTARLAAEQAVEARARFLANMTHELRTPMVGVLGMADVLLGTSLDDEQRSFATTIRNSGLAQLDVINEILDFSKIEAGKLQLDPCPLVLRAALHEIADQIAPRAQEKGIELVVDVDPDVPTGVLVDPTRLRQVLLNLMGNATKFTEVGHVVVRVSRTDTELCFRVEDSGIGIPAEAIGRLFSAFMQAESGTTRRFGGTGLGLTISKSLVELMGGRIGVESAAGKGSTFWFTVSLVPAQVDAEAVEVPEALRAGGCVVAIDEPVAREAICRALSQRGVPCRGVGAADALVSALTESLPAMLLFDPALSLGEGLGLVRSLKVQYPAMRVVGASPWALLAELRRAVGSALDDVVPRPVRPDAVIRAFQSQERARPRLAQTNQTFVGKVLLVEDNPVNQRVASLLLKRFGLIPDVAENGAVAVAMAASTRYDLIFMDCQMPVMDGFEATRAIRANETLRAPICALTANAMEGDKDRCLSVGMDDFMAKPFRPEQLEILLARWLDPVAALASV